MFERSLSVGFSFIAAVLSALVPWSSAAGQTQLLRWHERLETAAASARESGKPIFLVFRCVR